MAEIEKNAIHVGSIVSGRTFEPLVEITLGLERAQLGVEEAREHAAYILQCAEAAESDAFVFTWLTRDIIGSDEENVENWDRVIGEFRKFREARRL